MRSARYSLQEELLPRDMAIAVVSDHGFTAVRRYANVGKSDGKLELVAGTACARDEAAAKWLAGAAKDASSGVGREVTASEWKRFAPELPPCVAAYEPAEGALFTLKDRPAPAKVVGAHGLWPGRPDYRASFVMWYPGIKAEKLGEVSMVDLAGRFAKVLGVSVGK